ncbi:MAG: UspA domain protein [Actinomycetia bacterium]|nr:UspA domain protein [Actinomycetes bacterium]
MADPIVVGVDTTADSLRALSTAADLAEEHTTLLIAMHVRHEPTLASVATVAGEAVAIEPTLDELEVMTRTHVADVMAGRQVNWRFDVAFGDPGTELIKAAAEHRAGAIVVGGRNHGVVGGLVLGSVAQKLVRKSPVSVLVVRDGHTHRVNDASRSRGPVTSVGPDR